MYILYMYCTEVQSAESYGSAVVATEKAAASRTKTIRTICGTVMIAFQFHFDINDIIYISFVKGTAKNLEI
jgi:hypothetical protein